MDVIDENNKINVAFTLEIGKINFTAVMQRGGYINLAKNKRYFVCCVKISTAVPF